MCFHYSVNAEVEITDNVENSQQENILFGKLFLKKKKILIKLQHIWNKDTVHKDATTTIAEDYFSAPVAAKIGQYNREVDVKYSSGVGAISGSPNQYIHFNEYASGSDDSRDYAAATWFIASELAWDKGQKENAYMYLEYAPSPASRQGSSWTNW